jgi:hypothetical protein
MQYVPKMVGQIQKCVPHSKTRKKFHIDIWRQVQPKELLNHSTDDISTNPKDSTPTNHVTFKHIPAQNCWFPRL